MTTDTSKAHGPKRRDLTAGSLHRAIWVLAPAMMLETGILNVSNILDTYWVGKLGSAALAAVTMSITIRWVVNSLANGLGIGGWPSSLVALGPRTKQRLSMPPGRPSSLAFSYRCSSAA